MRRAQNTVKRGSFWPDRVVCGWGGGPSLLRRGENCRTAMPRPGGPWPDLRAAAPAADPGRSGKEAKLAEKRFGALHLEVLDLFAVYIVVKYI